MKIICVGRNYADHAKEMNNPAPKEPVIFLKPKTSLLIQDKPFYYPEFTDELHYECEVVIKFCKNGKFIQERFARKYYDQVTVGIDFTARDIQRDLQKKGLPWEISKAFDGSGAVGHFMNITDDMNMNDLDFELRLNGERVQNGNTKDMLFSIDKVVSYASRYFTINIGDILFSGTPAGVGPVNVQDKLEGYLLGEKLLDVDVW